MMQGTIVAVKVDKGFGFICPPDRNLRDDNLFFHARDLINLEFGESLVERRVEFDVEQTSKGPRARNVRPAD